jgi:hypothetical protein
VVQKFCQVKIEPVKESTVMFQALVVNRKLDRGCLKGRC